MAATTSITSKKKSKFFVDSLRAIRNHFRQIYRKCSCGLDTGKLPCMGEPNNNGNNNNCFGNGECFGTLIHSHASSWSSSCPVKNNNKNKSNSNKDTRNMFCRVEQNVHRYSHEDYDVWIGEMSEVNVGGSGLILPSPPPTPKKKILLNHPDGDFLCKVIPPPLEFQDRYFHQNEQHRPSSALSFCRRRRRFCHHQSSYGGGLTRTESEASLGLLVVREDDHCLKLPTLRSHSAISKFPNSRPNSRAADALRPKSRGGGFSINDDCFCAAAAAMSQTIFSENFGAIMLPLVGEQHGRRNIISQQIYQQRKKPSIHWKDLPKSICLNINNGFVESMFIPSWSNQVLRKAPFFSNFDKVINWTGISLRHERAEQRLARSQELRTKVMMKRQSVWNCRCQIGLLRRKLRHSDRDMKTEGVDGGGQGSSLGSRYHFIYWLNESDNDVNSIGRFLDTEGKRLVAIKTVAAKPPPSKLEQLHLQVGALREIDALMRMDHVNIVRLLGYFENLGKMHIIMEACDHSLRCEMAFAGNGGVDPTKAQTVITQILTGLNHCHEMHCLHRNLSPENILVTVSGVVKIADFSKAVFLNDGNSSSSRTASISALVDIRYAAPEMLALDPNLAVAADVWSVGCILLEMMRGRLIWRGNTPEEQLKLIHKTVGPLLPHHAVVAMINVKSYRARGSSSGVGKTLRDYVTRASDPTCAFIESCLQVDPSKRTSCSELLHAPFIKLASSSDCKQEPEQEQMSSTDPANNKMMTTSFPRMALWETQSGVLEQGEKTNTSSKLKEDEESKSTGCIPRPILKMSSSFPRKKPRASVAFASSTRNSAKPILSTLPPPFKRLSRQNLFPEPRLVKEELLGVGTKSFWHNLKQFSSLNYSDPGPSISMPAVRKAANQSRKIEGPVEGNFISDSTVKTSLPGSTDAARSNACRQCDTESNFTVELPAGPRSRIQYLISLLPTANWNTVNLYTNHLKSAARKTPKAFSAHIEPLVTVLLEQIGDSKSKIAGPAIRILNNICEYKSHLFEAEAERIIEVMLNKLGGPSFIEKECNQVLRHIVQALTPPSKAILTLVKIGGNHRISAARQSTIQLVEEAIKKLDLISEMGLPGEQTASQRRLSNAVFDIATRLLRDSSAHTRLSARNIYQHLMRHPGFWYLYQSTLPEEKRQWVNRLLDEMRRYPPAATGDRKASNSRCSNNNNNYYKSSSLV